MRLTADRNRLFDVQECVPHVSIAKPASKGWQAVGVALRHWERFKDWKTDEKGVSYSPAAQSWRRPFFAQVRALRTVHVVDGEQGSFSLRRTHIQTAQPTLEGVPEHLWATTKYDIGLIKNCAPVQITPKSTYRPNVHQYPLKKRRLSDKTSFQIIA